MRVDGESESGRRGPWADAAATGMAAAAMLLWCEAVKGARSSLWTPPNAVELQGALAAGGVYGACAAMAALILYALARAIAGSHRFAGPAIGAAPLLSAAVLFGAGQRLDAAVTPTFAAAAAALGMAFLLHRIAAHRRALTWPGAVSLIWTLAGVGGTLAAWAAASAFLIAPHREHVTVLGGALGAVAGFASGQSIRALARSIRLRTAAGLLRWPLTAAAATAALAAMLAPAGLPASGSANAPAQAPVVLITADTLRADVCSLYGGPVPFPRLTEIAATNGAIFERGYALGPWTLPSMFGMFASRIPPGLTPGADKDAWMEEITLYRMPADVRTLAEILRDRNYATGAFVANSLLHDPQGILRGFDTRIVTGHRTHTLRSSLRLTPFLESLCFATGLPFVEAWPADTTRILTAQAQAFIRANAGRPFFLWVHYMDPHTAFAPPKAFVSASWPWRIYCNADPYWGTPLTDEAGNVALTDEQRLNVRALYDGEAEYIDEAVGAVWDALAEHGAAGAAYFAFTSDHGEEFWERGAFGHGHSLFDELVRVPLVIRGPGVRTARVAGPVSALDLMPTLADLAGAEGDNAWQGRSLAPGLRDDRPVSASPAWARGSNVFSAGGPFEMVAAGDRKLIRDAASGAYTLYDLAADPAERRDLLEGAPPPPDLEALLEEGMARERRTVRDVYHTDGDAGGAAELDAQMRGMGYIR